MKVKVLIAYDGTDFAGWQRQESGKATIQGSIEEALSHFFNQPLTIFGAGRTDAGVHAKGQVAHFLAPKAFEGKKLLYALNSLTPQSISLHGLWEVPKDFHARTSARWKTYIYEIDNGLTPCVFKKRFSLWQKGRFDIELLNHYAQTLLGSQDFKSFQNQGSEVSHTVREIFEAKWERLAKDRLTFRITGNGFLRQMVRNIVGTLLKLHQEKAPSSVLVDIIHSQDRQCAGATAPPQGLCLDAIFYPDSLDSQCRKLYPPLKDPVVCPSHNFS